ncbi:hypothetical protein [Bosea beijingensis]|uniref:hypothetical protein n=1 Tax=Bosea beijingensis TaxID=3068632 RepID=UPI0027429B5E|nr:hypothetical protein [Bosea sp. REN20]
MKKFVLVLAGSLIASSPAILPGQAQTVSPPTKQRAPGVPLAPRSGEAARPPAANSAAPRDEKRGTSEDKAQTPVRPDRDLPMPKPVPSIIAP